MLCAIFLVGILGGAISSVINEEEEKKAEKYHVSMSAALSDRAEFQVTGDKAVTYMDKTYSTWYVPEAYIAESPEQVRYIIHAESGEELTGRYTDGTGAYRHWVEATVEDLASGQILGSKGFWGPEPPKTKSSEKAYHSYPDRDSICDWVQSVLEGTIVESMPQEERVPAEETEAQASAEQLEKEAALDEASVHLGFGYGESPMSLEQYLISQGFSREAARYAVENCGADWMEEAVKAATFALRHHPHTAQREEMLWHLEQSGFTPQQAEYAASVVLAEGATVTVHARVPAGWERPGCWAWSSQTGEDVFAAWPGREMGITGNWYTIELPAWVDYVIINANDGTVQTGDIWVEQGRDVWFLVYGSEDVEMSYMEPTE